MKLRYFLFLLLLPFAGHSQFFLNRVDTVVVFDNNQQLQFPFSGGLNFLVVSEIDLNFDGVKDLFIFDRSGDKVSTFINNGTPNQTDYQYAHEYTKRFPPLRGWALLRDIDCDGKEDIFTSTNAGVMVYRNTSDPVNGISFELMSPLLYAYYIPNPLGNYLNLYVTSIDIPAIVDVDDDGDLDILTFNFVGTTMAYFKNHSKEWYGNCDSLNAFVLTDDCWGNFAESFSTNTVFLNYCRNGNGSPRALSTEPDENRSSRHAGSCTMCADLNGDNLKDVVLGDISFSNMTKLINGGTINDANMVNQDTLFPMYNQPVNTPLFPCGFYVDVNNDGKRDMLVSPNAGGCSANNTSLWYYKNTNRDDSAYFEYQQNNFLIDQMLDLGEGAYPAFTDFDGDGLRDLILSNFGYLLPGCNYVSRLMALKNTGTALSPKFTVVSRDYAGLGNLNFRNIMPAFGDLDGDNDDDMVIGEVDGRLYYFENVAAPGTQASYVINTTLFNGIDVGNFSAPHLVDLNNDGKLDLVVGEGNGNLNYYQNVGTPTSPQFNVQATTDSLGKVLVTPPFFITGYSAPYFFKVNGLWQLFVGSANGDVYHYNGIENNLTGAFNLVNSKFQGIYEGIRSAPALADINNDGQLDMVLGNYSGGFHFYMGDLEAGTVQFKPQAGNHFLVYPNPTANTINFKIPDELYFMNYRLEIFNTNGQMVHSSNLPDKQHQQIELNNLTNGFYILKLSNGQSVYHSRVILNR
jgi:hypothetical protein